MSRRERVIDCGTCLLRPWSREDRASLVHHANNRKVWRNLLETFPHPYTFEDADEWLSLIKNRDEPRQFAIEVDAQAVGGIGFTVGDGVHQRSAEIGYWLGEEYWGRGIATAALRGLTEYVFGHHHICRIAAGVFGWNAPSMRVLEKAGYAREAVHRSAIYKDGRITDQVVYAMIRDTGEGERA